jgi:predicted ferric reductase
MSSVLASAGPSAYWYLTRATGAVALLLLSIAIALGVIDVERWSSLSLPRFVLDSLHRNASLLATVFIVVHILTSVLDSFASISIADAFVPFVGAYRPLWLGLGAVAFDLILAVVLTSLLRARMGFSTWRTVHWLTYASWPIALVHGFGTGSDANSGWLLALSAACTALVVGAVLARVVVGWPADIAWRGAALAGSGAFALFMLLWLPNGPLGREWARRSGTPKTLLAHTATSSHAGGGGR